MSNEPTKEPVQKQPSDASDYLHPMREGSIHSIIELMMQRHQYPVGSPERNHVKQSLFDLVFHAQPRDVATAMMVYEHITLAITYAAQAAELDNAVDVIRNNRGNAFGQALRSYNQIPGAFRRHAKHPLLPPTPHPDA